MSSQAAVLRVEDLGVTYGALVALQGMSWSVEAGQILGIIGPNGAGKSTCFDAVTNLVRRQGRVFLKGEDITDVPPHRLASHGLRRGFQQNAFFDNLSVIDNMVAVSQEELGTGLAGCIFNPIRERRRYAEARGRAAERLEWIGIDRSQHELLPTQISYGTQRMLSIALAYGGGADVLMLDEPAAGLGGTDLARLIALLRQIRDRGVALIVIEHHMDLIMSIADKIVVLDQGRMLATGRPAEIQANEAVLEAYLGRSA